MGNKRKIICIVGPNASGKTGWGVSVAKKIDGEIVSADSRQVYKGLDIGTGKDLKEYGDIKYHLIDICQPEESFTMFDWLAAARKVVEDIFSHGKTPIVVGGTGLYIQALVEGFTLEVKSEKLKVKSYRREELEKKSLKQLQEIFCKLKITKLKIDENNPHRLIRAIERAQAGEIVSKKKPDFEVLQIAVDLPREVLYRRIDQRVESRFKEGMLEETQGLIKSGVDPKWLLSLGLEYRILTDYLLCHPRFSRGSTNSKIQLSVDSRLRGNDNESFKEMKQKMKFAIHAYARRQFTWFRRFPEIVWCEDLKSAEKTIAKFLKT
ncbi:MAG: tRNA dimethylallyltransferase [Candidatus Berkelbacteria bacterium Athens1014_28]|uniref:tRNA dimethylallyltransferase n=1 Tax=Candidatus Berkelbacteria bacterium Athens1014_28 TaxID=2017145 RepID=A0A554LNZ2_9BACT|nr:MAG: tRNA dimethylallyltransferase [Candidatus Berkelbacteria bacterium Athens1014_28]